MCADDPQHLLCRRGRFCDCLGCGEGVFGPAGAFAALLEALVRPFDFVEYDGRSDLCFFVLVLLRPEADRMRVVGELAGARELERREETTLRCRPVVF